MADFNDDVFYSSITELNARLRKKEFTATELTRAFCDRLERMAPRFNALALSLRERAMKRAKEVDDEFKRERFKSPLQGVPVGVKDLLSVAGAVTTWGAKPYAGQVFDYNARVVDKLERAGALIIGKLSMVELAGGGGYNSPDASLFGPGVNPWDRGRWSGGSSSGSGSAVAAGLVTYAIGSETSGSILTPAAFCGITGLRPTYGLVSRYGAMALSWTMDKIGPMCHSADDCGHVLAAIAGKDELDPGTAGKSFYYAPQYTRPMKEIRVGYAPVDFAETAAAPTRAAFKTALEAVQALGVQLIETKLPDLPYGPVTGTVIAAEGSSVFQPLIETGKVDELADKRQIAGLRAGLEIPARDYLKAMRIRRVIQQELRRLLTDVDVLLAPARYGIASPINEPFDRGSGTPPGPSQPAPRPTGMRSLIPAGNLAGLPALSLPCGFADGLPIAIQLVSRPFTENVLLAMGKQFQAATDWHRRRPKL